MGWHTLPGPRNNLQSGKMFSERDEEFKVSGEDRRKKEEASYKRQVTHLSPLLVDRPLSRKVLDRRWNTISKEARKKPKHNSLGRR